MIRTFLFDFSYVLLFPKDASYTGTLNRLYCSLNSSGQSYDFWNYFSLNHELLAVLEDLKNNYPLYIFTSGTIQADPLLQPILNLLFKDAYSAEALGLAKDKSASYLYLSKKMDFPPGDILFIDDQKINLQAAEAAGLQTLLYDSNDRLINYLKNFTKK